MSAISHEAIGLLTPAVLDAAEEEFKPKELMIGSTETVAFPRMLDCASTVANKPGVSTSPLRTSLSADALSELGAYTNTCTSPWEVRVTVTVEKLTFRADAKFCDRASCWDTFGADGKCSTVVTTIPDDGVGGFGGKGGGIGGFGGRGK
jgi:hypothetical protein